MLLSVSLGGSTERFFKGVGYFWEHLGKLHKLAPYLSLLSFLVEMLQIYMKTEFYYEPTVQLPSLLGFCHFFPPSTAFFLKHFKTSFRLYVILPLHMST